MRQFKPGQLQTGSLYNISASYAITASHSLTNSPAFPFTGSARITGSLGVTGSISTTTGFLHNQSLDSTNRTVYDSLGANSIQWGNRNLTTNNGSVLDWNDPNNTTGITTIPISEQLDQQRINDQIAAQLLIANGKIITEQTIRQDARINGAIVYYNGDVAEWQRLANIVITTNESTIDNILGIVIDSDMNSILLQGTVTFQVDNGTPTLGFPTVEGAIMDGNPLYLTTNSADTESVALSVDIPNGAVRSMGYILQSVTESGLTTGIISFNPSNDYSRILSATDKIYQINGKDIYATSSYLAISSSFASTASYALTASYVENAQTASYVLNAVSASYAATASYANNFLVSGSITSIDAINFDTTATVAQPVTGRLSWNDTDGTLDIGLKGGNVTLQLGQEEVIRIVNKSGITLQESAYQVVRVRRVDEGGAQGQRLAVVLAQANNDLNSATTIGLVTETITDNQEGFITSNGLIRGIDTTGTLQGETWVDGDILYLSPTTPGALTKVKPLAPQHTVILGYVVYAHADNGKIFVKIDNGYELEELHNVSDANYSTPVDTDSLLTYDNANSLWKRLTWANVKSTLKTYFDSFYQPKAYIARSFTQSVGSAATGETQLLQITIPANTFASTDKIAFFAAFSKTGTAHNTTHRIKISTSSSMPTGTTSQIAQYASTNTILFTKINRELTISSGVLKGYPFTPSAVIDAGQSTSALSSVAFDVTQTQYLYISATPSATTTDVTRLEAFEIRNI
jgi:hypothetical protein